METLVDYLASKGIETYPASGAEVTAHCFFSCPPSSRGKGKLYLNTDSWLWDCKKCGEQGGKKTLLGHFGDRDEEEGTYLPGANPALRMRILSEYTNLGVDLLSRNDKALQYLLDRGLSGQTILDAKLGYAPRGFGMCRSLPGQHSVAELKATGMMREDGSDFHSGKILIPYLTRGHSVQVRGKDMEGKYFTPAGEQVRLYNADALRGAEEVLVTEGEFDALIVQQHLALSPEPRWRNLAVVAVPGTQSLPGGKEGFADFFRDAKRVYLGFDPDEPGRKGAIKAKELLGSKARLVLLPEEELADSDGHGVGCDWTEYLRAKSGMHPHGGHGWRDVADKISAADMAGKRIFSVAEVAARWRADKVARPGLKLGFPSLDAILDPGLRPGNVAIPLAKTGVGKTVFLANIAYNMRHVPWLHVTLENTAEEFFELLWRIFHFHNPLAEDFDIEREFPHLGVFDENRLSVDDFGVLLEEYTEQFGVKPEGGSIDYLGYMAHQSSGAGAYDKNSAAVMRVKEMAKHARMALITPAQVNRGIKDGEAFEGAEARDSGVIEETADFLFGLYRPAEAVDAARAVAAGNVTHELIAQVLKSRRGGKGKVAKLAMSHASLAVVDAHDHVATGRVQRENALLNQGFRYPQIAADQRQNALAAAQMKLRMVS